MFTNIRYVLITAVRDRLFIGLLAAIIFAAFVSGVMGNTAMLETQEMTVTLCAASARLILMIGLIVFTCFHVRAAFQTREIDVLLSRPVSRSKIVVSYWLGFACVATLLAMPTIVIMWIVGIIDMIGYFYWAASLLLETWLVVAIALFAAFTLRSATSSVLMSLGFYTLSRMIGFFTATAKSGILFGDYRINMVFRWVIDAISMVLPRLDFFGKSNWLIYGPAHSNDLHFFAIQAAIFIPLLIVASIIDFKRKQF